MLRSTRLPILVGWLALMMTFSRRIQAQEPDAQINLEVCYQTSLRRTLAENFVREIAIELPELRVTLGPCTEADLASERLVQIDLDGAAFELDDARHDELLQPYETFAIRGVEALRALLLQIPFAPTTVSDAAPTLPAQHQATSEPAATADSALRGRVLVSVGAMAALTFAALGQSGHIFLEGGFELQWSPRDRVGFVLAAATPSWVPETTFGREGEVSTSWWRMSFETYFATEIANKLWFLAGAGFGAFVLDGNTRARAGFQGRSFTSGIPTGHLNVGLVYECFHDLGFFVSARPVMLFGEAEVLGVDGTFLATGMAFVELSGGVRLALGD